MIERPVDLSFLQKAIARLDAGLTRYRQDIHDEQIRDGLIQRFEFTYEISHKTLKRFLEATSASPQEIDRMSFQDLIRTANEQDLLLGSWPDWRTYRDMRARSWQSYIPELAQDIVTGVPAFLNEVSHLAKRLRQAAGNPGSL